MKGLTSDAIRSCSHAETIRNALIRSIDPNVDVDSWMVLQGGHVARRWTGGARQSGCKTVLQGVTNGKGALQGMDRKGKHDVAIFAGVTHYHKSCNTT